MAGGYEEAGPAPGSLHRSPGLRRPPWVFPAALLVQRGGKARGQAWCPEGGRESGAAGVLETLGLGNRSNSDGAWDWGKGWNGVQSRGSACCPSQVMFRVLREATAVITELWLRCYQKTACSRGGRRKELSPCGCSHALCFPLVLMGSFFSKREKGGRNRILWAGTEHRPPVCAVLASCGCRPSGLEPPSPQQADLQPSGGLLRSRHRARGRGLGPAHLHVGTARPRVSPCGAPCLLSGLRVDCCSLVRDLHPSVRPRLYPQHLGLNPRGAQTS